MKSEEFDHQFTSKDNVLTNNFSAGNLKVNVNVKLRYNKIEDDQSNNETNNSETTIRSLFDEMIISSQTEGDNLTKNHLMGKCLKNQLNHEYTENKPTANNLDFEPNQTSTPNKFKIVQQRKSDDYVSLDKTIDNSTIDDPKTNSKINESTKLQSTNPLKYLSSNLKSSPMKSTSSSGLIKIPEVDEVDKEAHEDYFDENLKSSLITDPIDLIEHYEYASLSPSLSSDSSSLASNNSSGSKTSQLTDQLYNCDTNPKNPVVQVCVRIRPINTFETNNRSIKKIVEINEENSVLLFKDRRNNDEIRYRFKFNHLFYSKYNKTLEDNQEKIYTKIGQPYIQSILEGNDLCYFAYGQTGSGKSFTIMGDKSAPGLIFRFAKQLFEIADLNKRKDLEQLIGRLISDSNNTHLKQNTKESETNSTLLAAKKQLYEVSQKYGFTDVVDTPLMNYSFNNAHEQSSCSTADKSNKDKILRFDENIKIYKDDYIYHEKLFSISESEQSSIESFNNLEIQLNRQNLNILKDILAKYSDNQSENLKIEFSFKISFYEIYSESIYDLLEAGEERIKSKVREHPTNGPYIVNLTIKEINSMKELNLFYELGNKRRSRSSTTLNDQSSRSHAIFIIYITQTHHYQSNSNPLSPRKSSGPFTKTTKLHSKISFVDLAGSERASANDQFSDERLKEGNSINKSLLTLGKVITKLAWINKCIKKNNSEFDVSKNNTVFYVPYRDSVLTWLLKDCFNGKCKTFMIATIAPTSNHYDQTLSTLLYAHKASKIKMSFKFNHSIINQFFNSNDQKSTNQRSSNHDSSSKRLYIEHIESMRERLNKKDFKSDFNNNRSSNECEISSEFENSEFISTKLVESTFKSSLIEKIKEIFKDVL